MLRVVRPSPRFASLAPIAVTAATPALVLFLSVHALLGAELRDFRPFLNDEVYYWHQIATAAAVGTRGGYYSLEEQPPAVDVFHFGPHGPVYPLLVGGAARIVGWHRASAPIFNVVWIAACAVAFMLLARPAPKRAWLVAALLATFWPLSFWAASSMQESFHHGVALVLAGAFVAIARGSRRSLVIAWVVLLTALIVRPSWGVLLPGLCVLSLRRRTPGRVAAALVVSAIVLAGAVVTFTRIAAPMPGAFEFLRLARLERGIAPIVSNARDNLRRLSDVGDDYDRLEIVHRAEYLVLTIAVSVAAVWLWRRGRDSAECLNVAIQWSQLAGIVAAMLLLYTLTNWTEHRVVSAHVLLAALVLAATPGRFGPAVATSLVLVNLLAAPVYAEAFRQIRSDNFVWDRRPLRVFEETLGENVRYLPGASPWCNTLLSSQYPPDFIGVPPGIGISVTRDPDELPGPPRSRVLLLDPAAYDDIPGRDALVRLGTPLPYGAIYLNPNAGCPQ